MRERGGTQWFLLVLVIVLVAWYVVPDLRWQWFRAQAAERPVTARGLDWTLTTGIVSALDRSLAGVGFAVPVDTVNRVVPQLIAHGRYSPPSLGIEVDASVNRAITGELNVAGVAVLPVQSGSATQAAGLRALKIENNTACPATSSRRSTADRSTVSQPSRAFSTIIKWAIPSRCASGGRVASST